MDGYEALRAKAAAKLDAAITAARKEYRETCDKINALRRELGDEPDPSVRAGKTAIDAVREHMPRDRVFSNAEMLQLVQDSEPERHWNRGTVKAAIYKLADLKEIKRIVKDDRGHILWADAGLDVQEKPFAAMPMSDVIADVLETSGPLRPAEIVVKMQDLGCRAEDDPTYLVRLVSKTLYGNPRRFVKGRDRRWGVTA